MIYFLTVGLPIGGFQGPGGGAFSGDLPGGGGAFLGTFMSPKMSFKEHLELISYSFS